MNKFTIEHDGWIITVDRTEENKWWPTITWKSAPGNGGYKDERSFTLPYEVLAALSVLIYDLEVGALKKFNKWPSSLGPESFIHTTVSKG